MQNDAVSMMISGLEWDTVMSWLKQSGYNVEGDSSLYGNYSDENGNGSLKLSGSNENWKMNNIYDLAGNAAEYVGDEEYMMDNQTRIIANGKIKRGGSYLDNGKNVSISTREVFWEDEEQDVGSRLIIYILKR